MLSLNPSQSSLLNFVQTKKKYNRIDSESVNTEVLYTSSNLFNDKNKEINLKSEILQIRVIGRYVNVRITTNDFKYNL